MTNVYGFLTDLQTTPPSIPSGMTRIETIGYAASVQESNHAPGVYIEDSAFDLTTWPQTGFTAADGRKFRLNYESAPVKPGHFGVVGFSTNDDLAAMQQFCDFVSTFVCGNARLEGRCWLSDTLYFGPAGNSSAGDCATRVFHGTKMEIWSLGGAQFDKLVHMRNCKDRRFETCLILRGAFAGDDYVYAGRDDVGVGLWLEHCRGAYFREINAFRFYYAGVATQKTGTALKSNGDVENSNNNFITIDKLILQWIGTGDIYSESGVQSLNATWTSAAAGTTLDANGNPLREYGTGATAGYAVAGSFGQRSTITIDTAKLPPASLIGSNRDDLGTSYANQPILLYIDQQPYRLMSLDRTTGAATIFPWLPSSTGTSGTLTWAWGGGVVLHGSDANVIKIGVYEGRVVGVGLAIRSAQGPTIGVLALQNDCGPGIVFGDMLTGTNLQGNNTLIHSYYYESAQNHIIWATDFEDDLVSGQIISNMLHEWDDDGFESFKRLSPRETDNSYTDRTIPRWVIDQEGIRHLKKSHPISSGTHRIDTPQDVEHCRSNAPTWTLDNDSRITRLFDYDRQLLLVHGSGPNGSPTGTVTFNAPTNGSINGAGTVTWTGFHGPALFALYESQNDVWVVDLVAGQQRAGRESVHVSTSSANETLLAGSVTTRIYTGALSQHKTLTLPTSGINSGHEFHLTRTGGSGTGGPYNLSVGGLRNLDQNTWCIVRFDGSVWRLVAYGAL